MQKYYLTTLRLWNLLKPFHRHFYWQLFLIIITQLISIAIVYIISQVLNKITDQNFETATFYATGWFAINIVWAIINYYKNLHQSKYIDNGIGQYLEEYSFQKIFNLTPSQYLEDHSAVKLQVIHRGEVAVENIISTIVFNLIPTITQVVFSLVAIAFYSPLVAIICLIIFSVSIVWTNNFTNFHRTYVKKNMDNWDNQKKTRAESFQHLSLIKTSGMNDYYLSKYLLNRYKIIQYAIDTWRMSILHNNLRWTWFNFGRFLSTLVIIYQYSIGLLTVGSIFAIWTWLSEVFNNIRNVTEAMRQIPLRFVELDKYLDIIDKEPNFNESGSKKILFEDISFTNLSFKYPKSEKPVLENLNFTIQKGKKVAFVGFSGSGKSTIVKLLLRIYDWDKGDIKLGNRSIRDFEAQYLRQKIGYVEQHVDLFDSSIKDNILFGLKNKKIDNKYMNEIITKSRINSFYHRLGSSGIDTVIGERGVKLSGGERQRIGIARALIKNPEILIFDEATASLDTENEKYIQEAIDESSKGRTTIIIAHRLSTIQNSDIIFVMDKGKIVGSGSHDELKETCSEYQRLIHAQQQ